ncbi:MAG: nitroreductase family protein [Spirochaetaceae bacterium]|nr:nitroreductase family protein [Spirochaetaceae bacterium]
MEIMPEIQKRISVRNFKDIAIKQDVISRVLEAGQLAPSAKNRQPWRFLVIDNPELKKKIQEASYGQEHIGKSGVIILACSTNIEYEMPNGQQSYPIDISFAVSFMMLQAEHEGLGSCVITTYDEEEIKSLVSVPYSMRVVMMLLLGYTDEHLIVRDRQQIKRIFAFNHW